MRKTDELVCAEVFSSTPLYFSTRTSFTSGRKGKTNYAKSCLFTSLSSRSVKQSGQKHLKQLHSSTPARCKTFKISILKTQSKYLYSLSTSSLYNWILSTLGLRQQSCSCSKCCVVHRCKGEDNVLTVPLDKQKLHLLCGAT